MKKALISLILLTNVYNAIHTMELANPTKEQLTQAHKNMTDGLNGYNTKQFIEGYEIHHQASHYCTENRICDDRTNYLGNFEQHIMYELHSKKHKADQINYTAERYKTIQSRKEKIGIGLMLVGGIGAGFSANSAYEALGDDDDTISWWHITSPLGAFCTYNGLKLSCNSYIKSQQAEEIVAHRKKAILDIYNYILNMSKQAG